jgi:hypothetical protein
LASLKPWRQGYKRGKMQSGMAHLLKMLFAELVPE